MHIESYLTQQGVLSAQLTGSRLWGHNRDNSDVDIVVYTLPDFVPQHNITRVVLESGLSCHWEYVSCAEILPFTTVRPIWKRFGPQLLYKATDEHFRSFASDGEKFIQILLQHKDMLATQGAQLVFPDLQRWLKHQYESKCIVSKTHVVQGLISLHILANEYISTDELRAIKEGKINPMPYVQKIITTDISIPDNIDPTKTNLEIYKKFLSKEV